MRDLPSCHCSGCGDEVNIWDPEESDEDGYAACCNKRVCYGDGRDRYLLGEENSDQTSVVRACCAASASAQTERLGKVYLERII